MVHTHDKGGGGGCGKVKGTYQCRTDIRLAITHKIIPKHLSQYMIQSQRKGHTEKQK